MLENLVKECGQKLPPGTEVDIYYTCICELNGYPQTAKQLAVGDPLPGDSVRLAEPFDFTTAESGEGYWRKARILINTGGVKWDKEGDLGGEGFMSAFRFFIIGSEAEQIEFSVNLLKASGCIAMMIKQREATEMTVIGTDKIPAYVESIAGDGGEKNGDLNGAAYSIKFDSYLLKYDDGTHGIDVTPNI